MSQRDRGIDPSAVYRVYEHFRLNLQHTAVASVAQNVKWSYSWVDSESNRLARWMQLRGIGPGSNVGMFLPRSAEVQRRHGKHGCAGVDAVADAVACRCC
jgi:non-ribosomal peptide synthetase component F